MRALVLYESMFGNSAIVARLIADGLATGCEVTVADIREMVTEPGAGPTAPVTEPGTGTTAPVAGRTAAPARLTPALTDVDLLVLGGPTHAFSMSRPATRADAARQGPIRDGAQTAGIRDFLDRMPQLAGVRVAAFDTRSNTPLPTGSAGRKAMRRLRGLGGRQVLEPASFRVESAQGPLAPGEEARARQWGETLALSVRR
ncbi:flavodoxin family protein [Actinoplanes palleronii]|uniref:Flavodoxin n=1 Tax=Actinoplanes palleronii TaxID=113570 RepID=A0ABQ4BS54_9ACTN|nr:flavodoxin [Actinoplanes palleronii]GIE73503.1 flavodoxin [Actinoplanes palleronii]